MGTSFLNDKRSFSVVENGKRNTFNFCTECRTKVMKAYSLLVDEPEECQGDCHANNVCSSSLCEKNISVDSEKPDENAQSNSSNVKEKGFVPSLYAGIRRCTPNNHIHVDQRTDYIMGLILAAEPELLGNRRERHAKTLEIAQEEVLVCVGLCLYERVHRIQLRLREEQTTCQLLALVAINALSTNFQLAVEIKQGISQLELLFQEFSREDRLKQKRQQARKLKKRRKKERRNAVTVSTSGPEDDEEDSKIGNSIEDADEYQKTSVENSDNRDQDADCLAQSNGESDTEKDDDYNIKTFLRSGDDRFSHIGRDDILLSKYSDKKNDTCFCAHFEGLPDRKKNNRLNSSLCSDTKKMKKSSSLSCESSGDRVAEVIMPVKMAAKVGKMSKSHDLCRPIKDYSDTSSNSSNNSCNLYSKYQNDTDNCCDSSNSASVLMRSSPESSVPCDCCSGPQADCGYSSADNNIISSNGSGDSSVDSSEVACSEGFCNHDGSEECSFEIRHTGSGDNVGVKKSGSNYDYNKNSTLLLSASRSLEQMLTDTSWSDRGPNVDPRFGESIIPVEEIQRYKSCMGRINEKRMQLRQTLKSRFAQLCSQHKPESLPAS